MTPDDIYFRQLAQLRQALEQGDELPDYLRPEAQEVTQDTRDRVRHAREAILRGDIGALREQAQGFAAAGFDRDAEKLEEEIPELDVAREEVLREAEGTDDDEEQGEPDRAGDTQ